MALRAGYGIWFGLASMLWYVVWPGEHRLLYGMAWRTRMVYSMDWQALHGKHHMYMIMAYQARHGAWHSIWYRLVGMEWCMVWPSGQEMVNGTAWWARHDLWYGLAAMTWYMLWTGGHQLVHVYSMAWRTSHGIWFVLLGYVMVCGKVWHKGM